MEPWQDSTVSSYLSKNLSCHFPILLFSLSWNCPQNNRSNIEVHHWCHNHCCYLADQSGTNRVLQHFKVSFHKYSQITRFKRSEMIQSPNGLLPVLDWCVWYLDFIQLPNCCSRINQIYQLCSKRGWILWNPVVTDTVYFWRWEHCHSDSRSFCSRHNSYNRTCCKLLKHFIYIVYMYLPWIICDLLILVGRFCCWCSYHYPWLWKHGIQWFSSDWRIFCNCSKGWCSFCCCVLWVFLAFLSS